MKKGSLLNYLQRVRFFIEALSREPRTRQQLCDDWMFYEHSDGVQIESKKFYRLIDEIGELFGIFIKYRIVDREYVYYISNLERYDGSDLLDWCYAAFTMGDTLLSAKDLSDRILLETFPSENGRLSEIIKAMKRSRLVKISYQKYDSEEASEFVLAPYYIRQYQKRLYAFGNIDNDFICSFSLDRIKSLEILDEKFDMPLHHSAIDYFYSSYGVYVNEEKYPPVLVEIQAVPNEACYLVDVPMHPTQEIVERTNDSTIFRYFISPTNDFIGHLVSRGDRVKVLKPASLAEEVRKRHLDAVAIYN